MNLRKILALYDLKVNEWDKTRDFFTAQLVAAQTKDMGVATILAQRYQMQDVIITPKSSDEGAVWEGPRLRRTREKQEEE